MLVGRRLKLAERKSGEGVRKCIPCADSVVIRPCALRTIAEGPVKISTVHPTHSQEKRSPELRVVSLNLENQPTKEIKRSPHRMPSYCTQFKRSQSHCHKHEPNYDDEFVVRGFEVGSSTVSDEVNCLRETDSVPLTDGHCGELQSFKNGVHIQLTDCCQCVCDLFNSDTFQSLQDDSQFDYISTENCQTSRPLRQKGVMFTQTSSVLDPNILKVIRVTMNSKN